MFEHYILTRFNLPTPGRERFLRERPGWLEERFHLFERYCLPSVASQTVRNFSWLIYFDAQTPDQFIPRIEQLQSAFPFIPYFTELFDSTGWRRSIFETYPPKEPLVLTTRLDNDDAISADFVERLHIEVMSKKNPLGIYNFNNGLVKSRSAVYKEMHKSNPFFSYLERNDSLFETAANVHHMRIGSSAAIHEINGPPAWMQIVHGRNVSNRVKGKRTSPKMYISSFPFLDKERLDDPSATAIFLENATLGPIRKLRDNTISALRFLGIKS